MKNVLSFSHADEAGEANKDKRIINSQPFMHSVYKTAILICNYDTSKTEMAILGGLIKGE